MAGGYEKNENRNAPFGRENLRNSNEITIPRGSQAFSHQ